MKQLLILIATIFGLGVSAQTFTGSWEVFPNFGAPATLVETPEYVYTLAGTSLIGYDKATEELAAYNSSHRLNGNQVAGIWYDPEAKYLFVTYSDYNIDLVFDDGRTINVPDLRDAAINTDKTINGVAFYDGKAYVGSNSGLLVVDAQYGAVTESCLWGKQINLIAVTPEKLLIYYTGGDRWYVADRNTSHHNFDKAFARSNTPVAYPTNQALLSAAGKVAFISKNVAYLLDVDDKAANAEAITGTTQVSTGIEDKNIQVTNDGFLFAGTGKAHRINATTAEVTALDAPAGNKVASWDGKNLWLANNDGIAPFKDGASGARLKPNSTSGSNVGIFRQAPDGTIYLSTVGVHHSNMVYSLAYGKFSYIDKYSQGHLEPFISGTIRSLQNFEIVAPNYAEIIASTFSTGASKFDLSGKATNTYTQSNTNMLSNMLVRDVKIDDEGSLWFFQREIDSPYTMYLIKSAPGAWEQDINLSKWSILVLPNIGQNHSSRLVIDQKKGNIIASGSNGLAAIKMPPSDEGLSSSTSVAYCSMSTDEDGNSIGGWLYPSLEIDKNGWLWIASDAGVRVIRNSDDIFTPGFAPMRPKVPRNDGTNLADYLLDQVEVFHISVDENNEKWISTIGSGLYHVNADGTEIIEHFTTDNSQLPSNNVFATLPDKFSNKIFVGTDQGLTIYHSTSAPAKNDYKDVYAYPNPVTPEYTGHINVAGLMDGSLVKIADAAGNVLFHGTSSGGMITWNGCDSTGRRVKSGVYYVFASKTEEGESTNACVTKIVVVN